MSDSDGLLKRLNNQTGIRKHIVDLVITLAIVIIVVSLLYSFTNVWPPFINVGSGSMSPNINTGDVVMIVDVDKDISNDIDTEKGIITVHQSKSREGTHESFGNHGDVIVFRDEGFPIRIIHRAHFYVEEGENWYDRANKDYIEASSCNELSNCPAPRDGYITKGDNNPVYDQTNTVKPVKEENIHSKAQYKVFPFW